ncbi:hypothetical protein [Arthrobacter sp. GMC3]|uniref:hypothetical protein n=1 Tax=Arthrobacter sp. GMC3 TaxID=2058894 RepID=UPI0011B0E809|nr:hypothetical protein [Arthrobacter sp. GMC3]
MPPLVSARKMFIIGLIMTASGIVGYTVLPLALMWISPFVNLSEQVLLSIPALTNPVIFYGGLIFTAMSFVVRGFEHHAELVRQERAKPVVDDWDIRDLDERHGND